MTVRDWISRHRLTIWVLAFTFVTVWSLASLARHDAAIEASRDREAAEEVIENAEACVTSWLVREDLRDVVEEAIRAAVHTAHQAIIDIGIEQGSPPGPGVEERFREITDNLLKDDIAGARANIPDPECDLEEAQSLLR